MVGDHLHRIAYGGQVIDRIPFGKQRYIVDQLFELPIRQCELQCLHAVSESARKRMAIKSSHRHPQAAAGVSDCTDAKPLKPPFLRWTSNSEIAAGVTPAIRDAWP